MKLRQLTCLLLSALLLTACTAPQTAPTAPPAVSRLPDEAPFIAPIGDAGLSYDATAVLYLPSLNGQQLLAVYEPLAFTHSLHPAETILRALLAHKGDSRVKPVCSATLVPAGSDPVEVAGGVATVNLSAAALSIPREELHTVCRAITATLCELPDVEYVNILVAGVPVAMDEAGYLPLGSLTAQPGQELPVLWEQLLARRVPVDTLPTSVPLTATATLYFPLADGSGVTAEPRRITFSGQHPQQLVLGLIEALSTGPDSDIHASDLPDLTHLLTSAPQVTTLPEGGLRLTLHFTGDLRSWLESTGADPACTFAALVCTMTTFVPGLSQVCIYTGERAVTSVAIPRHGSRLFPGGVHERGAYSGYLMAQTPIYRVSEGLLKEDVVSLPYRSVYSPRALLLCLTDVSDDEALLNVAITDADLLGFAVSGDTLLINLSGRCAAIMQESPEEQRLIVYAIVNTMCRGLNIRRVRFFFDSTVVENLGSPLLWSGEFLYNPGLIR